MTFAILLPLFYCFVIFSDTSRLARRCEQDGKHYYFVNRGQMLADIAGDEYLEYGTYENAIYGTKIDTIRAIISEGKMAILDVEPQVSDESIALLE